MKLSCNVRSILLGASIMALGTKVRGKDIDCSKFAEILCRTVKAKSNEDTLHVSIFFKSPPLPRDDSACKGVDLKANPDSPCNNPGYDSVFWAKLKTENETMYARYASILKDVKNPTQSLPYPGDSANGFLGAVVTKTNLIAMSLDTLIQTAEPYFEASAIGIIYRQGANHAAYEGRRFSNYSVNGQTQSSKDRVRFFKIGVRK